METQNKPSHLKTGGCTQRIPVQVHNLIQQFEISYCMGFSGAMPWLLALLWYWCM